SIFMLGRTVLMTIVSAETARRLYLGMTMSVFRAPIAFFDKTPSSRILSRSSTDQKRADTDIPYRLAGLVFAFIQLFCVIVLMSMAAWQVLPLIVVVFGISIWYLHYSQGIGQDGRDSNDANLAALHRINFWGYYNPMFRSRENILDEGYVFN
ncbi:ABC transporter C family member 3-like, partial [Trifolium medium]|nr:ABC transporter C family member 3-like [Trifolium medium]